MFYTRNSKQDIYFCFVFYYRLSFFFRNFQSVTIYYSGRFYHSDCWFCRRFNRPEWNVIEDDIANVDFSHLEGKVDLLTGGFPCQPFSFAGKQLGFEDTRGTLFFDIERILKYKIPETFLLENVKKNPKRIEWDFLWF